MGTLLDAWRVIAPDGAQRLALVHIGGRLEYVDAPFLPYFYAKGTEAEVEQWLQDKGIGGVVSVTEEQCVALSDLEAGPSTWCKVEVQNVNVVKLTHTPHEPTWREVQRLRAHAEGALLDMDDGTDLDETDKTQAARFESVLKRKDVVFAENHLGFVERVLVDQPGWYADQTDKTLDDLTIIWLDIEQSAQPRRFPNHADPIVSIAWEIEGPGAARLAPEDREGVVVLDDADLADVGRAGGIGEVRYWDRRILKRFREIWKLADPDVVAGYNLHSYDLPMLIKRATACGLGSTWLCRGANKTPYTSKDKVGMWEKDRTQLSGRVVFDVFERVFIDQSLNGKVKDRGLKTVGKYRKLKVITEDTKNVMTVWLERRQRLVEYNKNDVTLCRSLGQPYWANVVAYAEETKAPLRHVVDASANFFGTAMTGSDFQYDVAPWLNGHRVLSDGTNQRRYAYLAGHAACPRKNNGKPVIVTGAHVGIKKKGAFAGGCAQHARYQNGCTDCIIGTAKVDVGGMYPSIIETYGLSPDNTVHVGFDDSESGSLFWAKVLPGSPVPHGVDAWREYHIPDHKWGGAHVIRVYGNGALARRITRSKELRKKVKRQMEAIEKEHGESVAREMGAYKALDGRQQMLKQANNSIYGNNANEYARYGSFAVSMTITGIGRLIGAMIEDHLGDSAIEVDTDGVYADRPASADDINATITSFVKKRCFLDKNTIKVELEEYAQSFFHSEKNYVLVRKDGSIVKHGSAIIGAKHCDLWDEAVDMAVREVFGIVNTGAYDAWRESVGTDLRVGRVPLTKLVQRMKIEPTSEYASNTMGKQVASSHVSTYGIEPIPDQNVEFIHTRLGFEVADAEGIERRVDVRHYLDLLADVKGLFLAKRPKVTTLADFA